MTTLSLSYNVTSTAFPSVTLTSTDYDNYGGVSTTITIGADFNVKGSYVALTITPTVTDVSASYTETALYLIRTRLVNLTVTPTAVAPGENITVSGKVEYYNGTAWVPLPSYTVQIYLIGSQYLLGTATTGPDGSFSGTYTVPSTIPIGESLSVAAGGTGFDPIPSGKVVVIISPAPEPPILPLIILAAILIILLLKRKK